jgi:glyoxylase-like metal-dependent hydrolase (beta-lactamase superfamily II)
MKQIFLFCLLAGWQSLSAQSQMDQPGYYRIQLGDYTITALSDGTVPIHLHDILTNVSHQEIDSLTTLSYQTPTEEASVNSYLLKINGKNILIDAGAAELYGPTLGHLPESLRKIGITPEQIDAVLVTHIHTDHTGGLIINDKMVFPNATIYISKPEFDFWMNAKNYTPRLAKWFKEAADKVGPYQQAGKVKTFEFGTQIFPGITALDAHGHTPGHTCYSLESKGEKMLFIGDMVHAASVQFPDPAVTINFDVDEKTAAIQRQKTFKDAAAKGYWLAADHISFPGIGHVRSQGKGYTWIPITYSTLGSGQ